MSEPKIAGLKSIEVDLEEGKSYAFCTCGHSANQPFCDGAHSLNSSLRPHIFTAEKTEKAWLCACKYSKKMPFCDGAHKALKSESP